MNLVFAFWLILCSPLKWSRAPKRSIWNNISGSVSNIKREKKLRERASRLLRCWSPSTFDWIVRAHAFLLGVVWIVIWHWRRIDNLLILTPHTQNSRQLASAKAVQCRPGVASMSTHTQKNGHTFICTRTFTQRKTVARASQFVCVLFRHSKKAFLHFAQMHTRKITCRNILLVCGFCSRREIGESMRIRCLVDN